MMMMSTHALSLSEQPGSQRYNGHKRSSSQAARQVWVVSGSLCQSCQGCWHAWHAAGAEPARRVTSASLAVAFSINLIPSHFNLSRSLHLTHRESLIVAQKRTRVQKLSLHICSTSKAWKLGTSMMHELCKTTPKPNHLWSKPRTMYKNHYLG